uniref:DOG1 domain-containing protein n=1 Tax=Kalanchoe fedtschenkoi TaxID=63787 RepID=A0A7N0V5Z5_KALFE
MDPLDMLTTTVQRRLAQNREAARKSRLRKKAYVQQLETSRLRLMQLEQELHQTRQQGVNTGGDFGASHLGISGAVTSGITAFEMEYGRWVEKNNKQLIELRSALDSRQSEAELSTLVDNVMKHYFELFQLKQTAAKADVFYLMSGMWKTIAERFFLWVGGFRPSELLKVLVPQLDPLAENQLLEICNLRRSCQQAEDALSQGLDKLQEIVVDTLAAGQMDDGSCIPQIAATMDKLRDLVSFVNQADHLRRETLNQMSQILTTYQAAQGLLALGDYLERLRALSSFWATRPREAA